MMGAWRHAAAAVARDDQLEDFGVGTVVERFPRRAGARGRQVRRLRTSATALGLASTSHVPVSALRPHTSGLGLELWFRLPNSELVLPNYVPRLHAIC